MSVPSIIGDTPRIGFGKTRSFGLWFRMLTDSKVLVLVGKGHVFRKKTTVLYTVKASKPPEEETDPETPPVFEPDDPENGTPVEETPEESNLPSITFKQKIEAEIVSTDYCGASISSSEFPIVVFVSEDNVVYSDPGMKKFKKFASIDEDDFYNLKSAGAGSSFTLPKPDTETYSDEPGELEETKKGLLVPLWQIETEDDGSGGVRIKEALELLTDSTLAFELVEEEETDGEPPEECEPHEGESDGGEGQGGIGVPGGGGGGEAGVPADVTGDGDNTQPCPAD